MIRGRGFLWENYKTKLTPPKRCKLGTKFFQPKKVYNICLLSKIFFHHNGEPFMYVFYQLYFVSVFCSKFLSVMVRHFSEKSVEDRLGVLGNRRTCLKMTKGTSKHL